MSKRYKEGQIVYRLAPVPSYDVSGTENWLADLADEGLFLTKSGFLADIAGFEVHEPRKVKYRLQAIPNKGDDVPDSEQLELGEKYNWEYVCKRGDFFIFRSFDSSARELNTDPEVQALALNTVRRKQRESFGSALFFLLVYPILLTRGCLLLSAIAIGTPWMIAAFVLEICAVGEQARAYFHLKKMQKTLAEEGYYESESNWRESFVPYQLKRHVSLIATIVLFFVLISTLLNETSPQSIPIKEFCGDLPFATITDFAGDGGSDYELTMEGFLDGKIDVIREKSDWIAPRWIEYNEHARITKADGSVINSGLYVDYIEMRSPRMAGMIIEEMYRYEKFRYFERTEKIEPLSLDADSVICFRNILHAPTVIMQKGRIVVRAYFYQTSPDYQIPFDEWAEIMCGSIKK